MKLRNPQCHQERGAIMHTAKPPHQVAAGWPESLHDDVQCPALFVGLTDFNRWWQVNIMLLCHPWLMLLLVEVLLVNKSQVWMAVKAHRASMVFHGNCLRIHWFCLYHTTWIEESRSAQLLVLTWAKMWRNVQLGRNLVVALGTNIQGFVSVAFFLETVRTTYCYFNGRRILTLSHLVYQLWYTYSVGFWLRISKCSFSFDNFCSRCNPPKVILQRYINLFF